MPNPTLLVYHSPSCWIQQFFNITARHTESNSLNTTDRHAESNSPWIPQPSMLNQTLNTTAHRAESNTSWMPQPSCWIRHFLHIADHHAESNTLWMPQPSCWIIQHSSNATDHHTEYHCLNTASHRAERNCMQWFHADKSNTVSTNSSERYYDVTQSRSGLFPRQPLTESSVQKAHTSLWLPATETVLSAVNLSPLQQWRVCLKKRYGLSRINRIRILYLS
jgi:hypothetical protein